MKNNLPEQATVFLKELSLLRNTSLLPTLKRIFTTEHSRSTRLLLTNLEVIKTSILGLFYTVWVQLAPKLPHGVVKGF